MHQQPHISIIVAVHNRALTLQRCIDSVGNQTYPRKELIIIDGGSTDGSVDILCQNDHLIDYWESKPDRGIYHAWNKGLEHATGDWIHFLGADDYFMDSHVLAEVAKGIRDCGTGIRIVYGKEAVVSTDGEVLEIKGDSWQKAGPKFSQKMSIPHPAVFHFRGIFDDHGRFDESFQICADYDLLLRELKNGQACFLSNLIVKGVTYGGASTRWDMMLTVAEETARARQRNGIFPYGPSWVGFYCKIFVKYWLARLVGDRITRHAVDLYRVLTGRPPVWTKM
ncbi:MAG: glycosyltransferase family 2 protein [Desulfomonilaceae bacterium]